MKQLYNLKDIFIEKIEKEICILESNLESAGSDKQAGEIEKKIQFKQYQIETIIQMYEEKAIENVYNDILNTNNTYKKAEKFKEIYFFKYGLYYKDNGKIDTYLLANLITTFLPCFIWCNRYFLYVRGVYKEVENGLYEKIIIQILEGKTTNSLLNEIIRRIEKLRLIEINDFYKYVNNKPNIINFKNGLLVFHEDFIKQKNPTYTFKKHTPDILTTFQIDVNFKNLTMNEAIKKTPYFQKFLNTSLNDDLERDLLIQKIAYTFIDARPEHEFTIVCGDGGNGKGVLDRLIKKLHLTSIPNLDISAMTDPKIRNQFFNQKFLNKPAVFTTEATEYLKDLGLIKKISGGDKITVEIKNKNINFDTTTNAKIFISTNPMLKMTWGDDIERRIHFLEMNNKIKKDKELEANLHTKELEYICFIVVQHLFKLIQNNFEFIMPESHFRLKRKYEEHNNNIFNFIKNHIVRDENSKILKNDMFELVNKEFLNTYKQKNRFFERLEKELEKVGYFYILKKGRANSLITGDEKNSMCYVGLKYVDFIDENTTTDILKEYEYNSRKMEDIEIREEIEMLAKKLEILQNEEMSRIRAKRDFLKVQQGGYVANNEKMFETAFNFQNENKKNNNVKENTIIKDINLKNI